MSCLRCEALVSGTYQRTPLFSASRLRLHWAGTGAYSSHLRQHFKEPVAWYGPIVMNTDDELEVAFEEYRNGTFIKQRKP